MSNRELLLQGKQGDQLMARFNALMDEERYRDAETLAHIAEETGFHKAGLRGAELTARMVSGAELTAPRRPFILPPLPSLLPYDAFKSRKTEGSAD